MYNRGFIFIMAKAFRDLLSSSGYSTNRADNPNVIRVRIENPVREAYGSETSGETLGPSNLFQDDSGPLVSGQVQLPTINNDIRTPGVIETTRVDKANLKKRPI